MKQILCFGDSNTYGLVPATTDRYGWGVRWTSIINEKLGLQEYRVIEEGLCGRTTVFDDPFREGRRGTQLFPTLLETHRLLDCIVITLLLLGIAQLRRFAGIQGRYDKQK